jgi:threonine dehydratase
MTLIHPFDDPLVIAGQGTIGAEILRHSQERLSAVFVPVGGGGLISGISGYIKALRPDVKIIGVEAFEADAMYRSLALGRRVQLEHVGIFADGVAVREVGERTFSIAQQTVDEVLRVTNDEVCAAIKDVFDDTRTVMEPAGALAVAGMKTWVEREGARNQSLVALLSGANINFDRLRFVAERAEVGEARETLIAITLPEKPGSFQKFCSVIGRRTVTEFNYRLSGRQQAHIFVGFATQSRQDGSSLISQLASAGYETVDLTDNELAKLHVRHLVGGPANAPNEILYRFEFPERPGALMRFLDAMSHDWNISLFHYRNHGADYGRVLVGMQVPRRETGAFKAFLKKIGYPSADETRNPAYRLFLV